MVDDLMSQILTSKVGTSAAICLAKEFMCLRVETVNRVRPNVNANAGDLLHEDSA